MFDPDINRAHEGDGAGGTTTMFVVILVIVFAAAWFL